MQIMCNTRHYEYIHFPALLVLVLTCFKQESSAKEKGL